MKGTIQIKVITKTENNFNDNKKEDTKKRSKVFLSAFILVLCLTLITLSLSSTISNTNYSSSFFVYAKEQSENDNVNNKTTSSHTIEYTHHKILVNGILMHYVIGGKGDPIVLLHGWPETWYEWRHVIPQLIANNYTVIAPDMRGLGDSERPQTGYDKKTVAEDIYQLVKKLGYSKVYLVAHDWGGLLHILMQLHILKMYVKWLYLILFYLDLELKKQQSFYQTDYGIFHFMQ